MHKPTFKTFQIILSVCFLMSIVVILFAMVWKVSDMNDNLRRLTTADRVRDQIYTLLMDPRACEFNFSRVSLASTPIVVEKLLDLRDVLVVKQKKPVNNTDIILSQMILREVTEERDDFDASLNLEFLDPKNQRTTSLFITLDTETNGDSRQIQTCRAVGY